MKSSSLSLLVEVEEFSSLILLELKLLALELWVLAFLLTVFRTIRLMVDAAF
jgi:hypothetical protein